MPATDNARAGCVIRREKANATRRSCESSSKKQGLRGARRRHSQRNACRRSDFEVRMGTGCRASGTAVWQKHHTREINVSNLLIAAILPRLRPHRLANSARVGGALCPGPGEPKILALPFAQVSSCTIRFRSFSDRGKLFCCSRPFWDCCLSPPARHPPSPTRMNSLRPVGSHRRQTIIHRSLGARTSQRNLFQSPPGPVLPIEMQ